MLTHSKAVYRDQAGLRSDSRRATPDPRVIMVKEAEPLIRWDQDLRSSDIEVCRYLVIHPMIKEQQPHSSVIRAGLPAVPCQD